MPADCVLPNLKGKIGFSFKILKAKRIEKFPQAHHCMNQSSIPSHSSMPVNQWSETMPEHFIAVPGISVSL